MLSVLGTWEEAQSSEARLWRREEWLYYFTLSWGCVQGLVPPSLHNQHCLQISGRACETGLAEENGRLTLTAGPNIKEEGKSA